MLEEKIKQDVREGWEGPLWFGWAETASEEVRK